MENEAMQENNPKFPGIIAKLNELDSTVTDILEMMDTINYRLIGDPSTQLKACAVEASEENDFVTIANGRLDSIASTLKDIRFRCDNITLEIAQT